MKSEMVVETASKDEVNNLVKGKMKVKIGERLCEMKRVLFSNEMTDNLVSVGRLCDDGMVVVFDKDVVRVYERDKVCVDGEEFVTSKRGSNGLYLISMKPDNGCEKRVACKKDSIPAKEVVCQV